MTALAIFGGTLLAATLLSAVAERTVLSSAVLFLAAGLLTGARGLGAWDLAEGIWELAPFLEAVLFIVLFNEGFAVDFRRLRAHAELAARSIYLVVPLTGFAVAALGRGLLDLSWPAALVLGAILSPTDPVFASALLGNGSVSRRLRDLLSVESGLNDGVALPFVLIAVSLLKHDAIAWGEVIAPILGGVALGIAVPMIVLWLARRRWLGVADNYRVPGLIASAMLLYVLAKVLGANEFLAAFTAGAAFGNGAQRARDSFEPFARTGTELAKLGVVFVFAVGFPAEAWRLPSVAEATFLVATLALVRPAVFVVSGLYHRLGRKNGALAAWFGPRGVASIFYAVLVCQSRDAALEEVWQLVCWTVGLSIVLHSTTDVPMARWASDAAENVDRENA